MSRKPNSRKTPCEECGCNTGVRHRVACKWAYLPRPTIKAQVKRLTPKEKLQIIINVIKS